MSDHKGWQVCCIATDWNYYEELLNPTHWMPLPPPPHNPAVQATARAGAVSNDDET